MCFKSVDKLNISTKAAAAPKKDKTTGFDQQFDKEVKKLPLVVPSDIVVMKATVFLLTQGLLTIPDVGVINVNRFVRVFDMQLGYKII